MKPNSSCALTQTIIDRSAMEYNLKVLKDFSASRMLRSRREIVKDGNLSSGDVLAVIKADAYGHGMLEIAKCIRKHKNIQIAVSDVAEGKLLREAGVKGFILLLETSLPEQAREIVKYDLTPTVCGWELAQALNQAAQHLKKSFPIHIKVDTGMRRQGIRLEEAFGFISEVFCLKHLYVQGIYTHFPSADADRKLTLKQIQEFKDFVAILQEHGLHIPFVYADNSAGLLGFDAQVFNLFRIGLALYGLYPSTALKKKIKLKPVMSVKSCVILIKTIYPQESISYAQTFTAQKMMTVAVIPIGYNDGYFRVFSNKAYVLIGGQRCSVLGRVTMDQIMVDISAVKNPKLGMEVVILGRQGQKEITADDLAVWANTINYEIVCALGNRLPRSYRKNMSCE